jgi:intein/homing endonuclease
MESTNIDPLILAYIAGFFDGEGCITTNKRRANRYPIVCRFTQAEKSILEFMQSFFGGTIICSKPKGRNVIYFLRFGTSASIDLLKALLPYIIVKREQAQLVIDYYDFFVVNRMKSNKKLTQFEREREETVVQLLKQIKQKQLKQALLMPTRSDDETNAYVAGVFDGEGCIYIARRIKAHGKIEHALRCAVTQYIKQLVLYIQSLFVGFVITTYKNNSKGKRYYKCVVAYDKAKLFLEQIYPYLRLKKEQANLGIEFQNGFIYRGQRIGTEKYSEIIKSRDIQLNLLKKLKVVNAT